MSIKNAVIILFTGNNRVMLLQDIKKENTKKPYEVSQIKYVKWEDIFDYQLKDYVKNSIIKLMRKGKVPVLQKHLKYLQNKPPLGGGFNNIYIDKYMKYKLKYLKLENKI